MSVQDTLRSIREFAQEKGSVALTNMVDTNYMEIERDYALHGEPLGPGKSMEWFEVEHEKYHIKKELESEERQNFLAKVYREGIELGDYIQVGTRFVATPKFALRQIYYRSGYILENADGEHRGLTDHEILTAILDLLDAVDNLMEAKEKMTA